MAAATRRPSVAVNVGGVKVGGNNPIVVQSMTNTDTADVMSTVNQVMALANAGSELVRVTVNNDQAAAAVPRIVETLYKFGIRVPIVGDFHYNGHLLLKKYPECARALAKYRINPGNVNIGKKHDDNFRKMAADPEFKGIVSDKPRTWGPRPVTTSRKPACSTSRAAYDQSLRPRAAYAARCSTGERE